MLAILPLNRTMASSNAVNVTLSNAISGERISNQKITAIEILENGKKAWHTSGVTDENGKLTLTLDGIDQGQAFQLTVKYYNNFTAQTAAISRAGEIDFKVGSTEITVMNSAITPSQPLPNHRVWVPVIKENGKLQYFTSAITDKDGKLRLDLPDLGQGANYKLQMKSMINGSWVYSDAIMEKTGLHTINIGNPPLNVTLKNGISGEQIKDQRVDLYEILTNGKHQWRALQYTDNQGFLAFDVNGFDGNREYYLRAKVYNGFSTKTELFNTVDERIFKIGTTEITVLNGSADSPTPLTRTKIQVPIVKDDGKLQYFTQAITDDEGKLRLNLPNLGNGTDYKLKMKSLVNDNWVYSDAIMHKPGRHTISIGNRPLNVILKNDISNERIKDQRIDLYEVMSNGKHQWRALQHTDKNGLATFDINGFDGEREYYLTTNVYNKFKSKTQRFSTAKERIFPIGSTEITVINGAVAPALPLSHYPIYIKKVNTDGKLKHFIRVITNNEGKLHLDLPGLGDGTHYTLQMKSVVDGSWIYSDAIIKQAGVQTISIGNRPLNVTLKNSITHDIIKNQRIYLYERLDNGKNQWRASRLSDDNGLVTFDINGFDDERQYYLRTKLYNGFTAKTELFNSVKARIFNIGSTEITVMNGSVSPPVPLVNYQVRIPIVKDDGKLKYFTRAMTDNEGKLRLDLPNLGHGTDYKLQIRSTINNSWVYSDVIKNPGVMTISIGNLPLNVTLKNALSQLPLKEKRIYLYEIKPDGKHQWRGSQYTDNDGFIAFDVKGFDGTRQYYLRTRVYNGFTAKTKLFNTAGTRTFNIGSTEITVLNGSVNPAEVLANYDIRVPIFKDDGRLQYFTHVKTDNDGILRLDLPGLDSGTQYKLQMKSVVNNNWVYSNALIDRRGRHTITVGNHPLKVTLKNALSEERIKEQRVDLYEVLPSGKHQWRNVQHTDNQGLATFDISGFDGTRQYYLRAKVYNNFNEKTKLFTSAGQRTFDVGSTEITVINGSVNPNEVLANRSIRIPVVAANGKSHYFTSVTTDNNGRLRVDLPGLGDGTHYKLQMKSIINNSWIYSDTVMKKSGLHTISIGHQPLKVTLKNGINGSPIKEQHVDLYEILDNGKHQWRARQHTDIKGLIYFDIGGFDGKRQYYLRSKVYNNASTKSELFTTRHERTFKIGTTEITVINATQTPSIPLSNYNVRIPLVSADGKLKYFTSMMTDNEGKLRLNLPNVSNGTHYKLQMQSLINGSWIDSDTMISTAGLHTIPIGSPALRVSVVNDITGLPLANLSVAAREILSDGSDIFRSHQKTDANGQLAFDLNGLGTGRQFILRSTPYKTGWVDSTVISSAGNFTYRVGTTAVSLMDSDNSEPLTGKRVHAFIVNPDDSITWKRRGTTDVTGNVHFDLAGIPSGERYVLLVSNPYGKNKHYYSDIIYHQGPITFAISANSDSPLDTQRPIANIISPINKSKVSQSGFTLTGLANDENKIDSVLVDINDSFKGQSHGVAHYDILTQKWQYNVAADNISNNSTIDVRVTVIDTANNHTLLLSQYSVIEDQIAPTINITSHKEGDDVSAMGFTLKGTTNDDIEISELLATVTDPILGKTVFEKPLNVSLHTGKWAFTILNGQLSEGQILNITLTVKDSLNNQTVKSIKLDVISVPYEKLQLINRISFGVTPQLYNEVTNKGADTYRNEQLSPSDIDDTPFATSMENFVVDSDAALREYLIRHMLFSKRQLQEIMTWFWENHFSTDLDKTKNYSWELRENMGFRENALGKFRDLLEVSAKSPAMLTYLDSVDNVKAEPNENYARELLELHTMGVDGGYSHGDIEALARVFTGWHIADNQFNFNAEAHNTDDKTVLGQTIAGGGVEEGERVLDILARTPSTAQFICFKLSQVFISDTPPQNLVDNCALLFLNSEGDIRQVVQLLLTSPEFGDANYYRAKIKTPLKYVTGIIRGINAEPNYHQLYRGMTAMGLKLLGNDLPTGWSETGDDWLSSNLLLQRLRFNYRVLHIPSNNKFPEINLTELVQSNGYETSDGIVGFTLNLLLNREFTKLEFEIAQSILTKDGPFDMYNADTEYRLKRLFSTVMSFPGYQYQ